MRGMSRRRSMVQGNAGYAVLGQMRIGRQHSIAQIALAGIDYAKYSIRIPSRSSIHNMITLSSHKLWIFKIGNEELHRYLENC